MGKWTDEELEKIGAAEELEIMPLRDNGGLASPVTIWVVRLGEELYVRSWRGSGSDWFRGVLERHAGRIRAGGVEKDVVFVEELDPEINDQIDAVYRTKYREHEAQYVDPMVVSPARETTVRLVPQA